MDKAKTQEMAKKLTENKMDLNDLLEQLEQIKKLGPLKSVISKIPGIGNKVDDIDIDDRQMDRLAAIILSMTPEERSKPNIINPSRKRRIASGSGMKVEDVNKLLKQFEQMQKMVKQLKPKATKKGKKKRLLPGLGGLTKF